VHSPGLILGLARNGPPAVIGPIGGPPPVWLAGWSARAQLQAPIFLATNVNKAISAALRNLQRYSVDVFASINSASEVGVHVCSRAQRAIAQVTGRRHNIHACDKVFVDPFGKGLC
jgi:hypothetical protein